MFYAFVAICGPEGFAAHATMSLGGEAAVGDIGLESIFHEASTSAAGTRQGGRRALHAVRVSIRRLPEGNGQGTRHTMTRKDETAETAKTAEKIFSQEISALSAVSAVRSYRCCQSQPAGLASQSCGISPIGAPGGASGVACGNGRAGSSGRSRKRLMSAAISCRCAVSSSFLFTALLARVISFDSL